MKDFSTILITGASSGIGAAIALHYAQAGKRLCLTGRNEQRLEEVAARCRGAGAEVVTSLIDVTDRLALTDWIEKLDDEAPIDLAIANAGISAGTGKGTESAEQAHRIYAVNVEGVMSTLQPLVPRMTNRRKGQLAVVSSLAAFRGFPGAPAYCGSKAAVRVWAEGLRGELAGQGVGVSVICPGFVKSAMTAVNEFPMPLLMESERAAQIIARGLERDRARIAFPFPLYAAVWLLSALPPGLMDRALARLPRKGG